MNLNNEKQYIPYEKIIDYLGIEKGDNIYLASQVLRIAMICKKHGEIFLPGNFIDSVIDKIGKNGTVFIPTFNWNFSNRGFYDYYKSPCTTGSLGQEALKRTDFKRTKHPMHSFAVWGKARDEIVDKKQIDSYDDNSPFEFMLQNKGKCILAGTDYRHGYTFIHFVERKVGVPYRFTKFFSGIYKDENEKEETREYSSYVRYLNIDMEEKFNSIGEILEDKNISQKYYLNGEPFIVCDIAKSYAVIQEDILDNKCGNLYLIK